MEKIKVKWEVSIEERTEIIPLEDVGCENIEEWNSLSKEEQEKRLQKVIDELPEQVSMIVDNWDIV